MLSLGYRRIPEHFKPGKKIFSWTACDYHPHKRGTLWYVLFCGIFLLGSIWAIWNDPKWGWLVAFTFFVAMAAYFKEHANGDETHEIHVFEKALMIDTAQLIPFDTFSGYWFAYDETVSTINFQVKSKHDQKITLQMGDKLPEFFRYKLAKTSLEELEDQKESLLDLWIRVLKL
jgi:hypothetical protein